MPWGARRRRQARLRDAGRRAALGAAPGAAHGGPRHEARRRSGRRPDLGVRDAGRAAARAVICAFAARSFACIGAQGGLDSWTSELMGRRGQARVQIKQHIDLAPSSICSICSDGDFWESRDFVAEEAFDTHSGVRLAAPCWRHRESQASDPISPKRWGRRRRCSLIVIIIVLLLLLLFLPLLVSLQKRVWLALTSNVPCYLGRAHSGHSSHTTLATGATFRQIRSKPPELVDFTA